MKWFIVYLVYQSCSGVGFYPSNCSSGNYPAEMAVPSREVCEQIVKDNPSQPLKCWAKPESESKAGETTIMPPTYFGTLNITPQSR